jgi:hypothetical protein
VSLTLAFEVARMPLPTTTKTWLFNVNRALAGTGSPCTDHRQVLFTIVSGLLSFAVSPWKVVGSADGFSAAGNFLDGTNRWTDVSKLIWQSPGNPHSWIVLRQSSVLSGFQLLLACESASADGALLTIAVSPGGLYTAGSNSNRPTATDEILLCNGSSWLLGSSSQICRLHLVMSDDGQVTRVFVHSNNLCILYWDFSRVNSTVGGLGWSTPFLVLARGGNPALSQPSYALGSNGSGIRSKWNNILTEMLYTGEGWNGGLGGQRYTRASDLDGSFPFFPIGLASETSLAFGRYGMVHDLWWGACNPPVMEGSWYPNDLTYQFVQFGNLILKWNGTQPLTA